MADRELVLTWLNDAHALEKALEEVLERHISDAQDHPDVRSKLQEHLDQTRRHAEQVAQCIESVGGNVSQAKSTVANMFGAMQGMMNRPMKDTLVRNAIADYTAEHFEIASYRALADAANEIGEDKVAAACEEICQQEIAMATWLEQQLSSVVKETVRRN